MNENVTNRRNVMQAMLLLATAARSGSAAASWPDGIFTLQSGKTTKQSFGEVTVYFDGATEQVPSMVAGSVLLYPGQEPHPPHHHPEEEFMLVTEGQGEF